MKKPKLDKIRSIRINSVLDEQWHTYADSIDRSANYIVNKALAEYLFIHTADSPKTGEHKEQLND